MNFEEVYGRTVRGELSQAKAAEILGTSERTFRRWRGRFEVDGAEGLYDRRLGRASARRAPVDEVARVLELFDTRYYDVTAKHFHEKLMAEQGCKRSYNWVRLTLHGMHVDVCARPLMRPDRDHGRRHERDLLGLLRRRGGHDVELPGAV